MAPLVPKDGGRMDAGCGVWGGAAGPAIPGQCPPRITLDAVGAFLQEQWHRVSPPHRACVRLIPIHEMLWDS